ncbi:hypothetical protein N7457_004650 [Penicillium paradoxum]|uniref:uncharacterized protein n=1 Tax=Penicillium paradoxum TaxID=176176 RepID=UPI0025492CA1|nr:uncharacterized protein N7457_004650 [Penicillium paradoxum]KAJ5782876.1 hypothetical protein N7457_004650 [Penicillium paradoxum]
MQYKTIALLFAVTAWAETETETSPADKLTDDPILMSLMAVPTWVLDAESSARPSGWEESLRSDFAFASSVMAADNAGTFPAWYSNLPKSVQEYETTHREALSAYAQTATQDWITFTDSPTTATPSATVATSTNTASSASGTDATSTSTGGAPAVTGDVLLGLAGAAGILGLAIAL